MSLSDLYLQCLKQHPDLSCIEFINTCVEYNARNEQQVAWLEFNGDANDFLFHRQYAAAKINGSAYYLKFFFSNVPIFYKFISLSSYITSGDWESLLVIAKAFRKSPSVIVGKQYHVIRLEPLQDFSQSENNWWYD